MTSNEECREIAKELRKLADSPYSSDDVRSDVRTEDMCYELGLERGFHDDCVDPESVKRLADLIDRPTCHMEWNDLLGCWECSNCGETWGNIYDDNLYKPYFKYCSMCGAEVKE